MLKLTLLELFLRAVPEAFLLILGSYVFANKSIEKKAYFISSILLAIGIYLIRILPIHFGVHTIIVIMLIILLTTSLNKISIVKAISSSLFWIVILSMSESLNVIVLNWLKIDVNGVFNNALSKILYSLPSLILFALIILLFYIIRYKNKKEGIKNVFN